MSYLLSTPSVVLAVGFSRETVERFRTELLEGAATDLEAVEDHGNAPDAVASRPDVGCVLVGDETDADVIGTCESIAEREPLVPIVGVFEDGDESLVHRFLRAGGDEYVPVPGQRDRLESTVAAAMESYEDRRAEHAQSTMFDSLLSDSSIPLYAKDTDARYVRKSVVPGGRNPTELIGKTDLEVYDDHEDAAGEWYEDDVTVLESEEAIYDQEERYDTAEGEYWSRTTKIPWYDGDELLGLLGMSFDITEYVEYRYRLEEYRDQFEKFASSVRHDLNNPLQVASGNLELARETGEQAPLERTGKALDRIDEMLTDLSNIAMEEERTLSRSRMADSTFETVALQSVEMVALVEDIWDVLETDDATLQCDLPPATLLYGPEAAIRPVLENLLKNAVRHAGRAPSVRVGHVPEGGFFVEDDGPGIPEDVRDRVFEAGFTTSEEGSGTGLSLVADIANRRGWTVEITESTLGGARIEVHNCLLVTSDRLHERTGPDLALDEATSVGDLEVEGQATYDDASGQWTVEGGGMNVWQHTNEFYYVYATLEGPVSLQAEVTDLEHVGDYSKAGLMVRDSLDEDATYGHVGIIPDNRTEVLWRMGHGEEGVSQFVDREPDSPAILRVDRVDNTVTVAVSDGDGEWTPVNERRVQLADPVHVGLVVCSFRPNKRCRAVFEDVSVHRLDDADA